MSFINIRIAIAQKQAAYYFRLADKAFADHNAEFHALYTALARRHCQTAWNLLHQV